jgi:2-oxoglutarate decarboxylase
MAVEMNKTEIWDVIAREFGPNASYVGELMTRFLSEPESIDPDWQAYFTNLIGDRPKPAPESRPAPAQPPAQQAAAPKEATPTPAPAPSASNGDSGVERQPIRGVALKIVENMETSLSVPTATSQRQIPLRLLDENRQLINKHHQSIGKPRISYTHLIAWALLRALDKFPGLNDGFELVDGKPHRLVRPDVNLGVAIDVTKKDGTRTLLVPNVKEANRLTFSGFVAAYEDIVARARTGKLQIADFEKTTISITNPGTIGTTASNPRLMAGQGLIFATGSIGYPPEYQAVAPEALSRLGLSKIMTITSTYDHRIVQGAESGGLLARIHELVLGADTFYEQVFADLGIPYKPLHWSVDHNPAFFASDQRIEEKTKKQAKVLALINMYRVRGHLIADLDPLKAKAVRHHPELDMEDYGLTIWDLDRTFVTSGLGGVESATLREIVEMLRRFYCGTIGYEYRHIQSPEEKEWLRARIEADPPPIAPEVRKQILWKLISAEQFERFLGRKYIGQKRFSVEGNEMVVAFLDQLIEVGAARGVRDVTIGMAHRGRLNVIANVIGKFCERIFTIFEGSVHPDFPSDANDVKYHQAASGVRETEHGPVQLTVAPNPSHLEFVNPVVCGRVRAKQDRDGHSDATVVPVLLHGDAAFPGEGVVAETLNMSQLEGYATGGTIHLIVNNQIGFTTDPEQGRSSTYSTDVAKMIQAPILHVNGDDPDAAYHALQISIDYRQRFHKDIVVDLFGFRRHGHNEGDEPTYTQPVMYRRVEAHPGVRALYARKLVEDGVMTEDEVNKLIEERNHRYENALTGAKEILKRQQGSTPTVPPPVEEPEAVEVLATAIETETMRAVADDITSVPQQFNLNPKIVTLLSRRAKMARGEAPVDWGFGEGLAFGSLVLEGNPVRLTGEDVTRGTFSHRHAVFYDTKTDEPWIPVSHLDADQARFEIYDSPLSETGVLGFEYGYSINAPDSLVLWEAQFGDFVNAAQVIVDQFIASGEQKWGQTSRLVLLLPHGYEGQGPEHSSARLERFLQLCANGNMQVCNPSTPAQYFHMLRRQVLQRESKPLIVMTPKSLLRLPEASSPIGDLSTGGFYPVLDDRAADANAVERVIVCSGKVYYELSAARANLEEARAAIVRLEQLYPFPKQNLQDILARYAKASEVLWVQEEPKNQGAWSFLEPRLREILGANQRLRYVGRAPSASSATGSHTIHQMEQKQLVADAFSAPRDRAPLSEGELNARGATVPAPIIHGTQTDG